jgi:protein-disulfide isomerase
MAQTIGLDVDKFKTDLDSGKLKAVVDKDLADGETAGVYGTPAFYIDGKQYNGEVTLAALRPIIADELKGNKEKTEAAK